MNLKLRFLAWWTPEYVLIKMLNRVAELTLETLDGLLRQYAPSDLGMINVKENRSARSLEQIRYRMSRDHEVRVKALIDVLGIEKTISLGREMLFKTGLRLGEEVRKELSVDNDLKDLVRAARVLYRVLGINFTVKFEGKSLAYLLINRCDLANCYSSPTCFILSATDEGVITGLNPKIKMVFEKRMTEGYRECKAKIKLDQEEK